MRKCLFMLSFYSALTVAQQQASGFVFEDSNKNGIRDRREKPLANVAVSNGTEVVTTDQKGHYSLPIQDGQIVFVIKPEQFSTKINENFLPAYYYIHKPNGSVKGLKYGGVEPTGPLPKEINFPLYPQKEEKNFQIMVFGDPQPYDEKELDYFQRGIVNEAKNNKKNAVFGISLGDLVGNDLSLHPSYIQVMKSLGLPWYNVMGNHDMDFDVTKDEDSDETFENHFGPNNYAFNYGRVHFIILDDILYPDPRDGKDYWGGFRKDQLDFVENDLKLVDQDKLVVVSFHIQMKPDNANDKNFRMEDRQRLFNLLKDYPNVLFMSAHTHKQTQIFYDKTDGWEGAKPLHEYNAGTTSGDWYSGTTDAMGVPQSTMRDGTFRGYSYVDFSDNQYTITYKVAGKPEDFQINLHVPKTIPYKTKNSAKVVANVFMGSQGDVVEYRIDNEEWKPMDYTETIDPQYTGSVLQWDVMDNLLPGRRPSNPDLSRHIWTGGFSRKLEKGTHQVEVRATDRFGRKSNAKASFEVKDAQLIP